MVLVSVMQYHKSNNVRYRNAGQTRYESVLSWEDQLFIQRQRQNAAVLLSLLERQQEVGLQRLPALKDNKRACGWNRWKSIDSPKSTSVEPLNVQAASKIVGLNFWTVPFTEIAIKKKQLHCVFSEGFHIHASQSSKSTVALKQSVFSQFWGHGERKAAEVGLRHQTPPLDLLGLLKLLLWTPGGRYECFCLKQLCPVYCWRFASHWACVSVCAFIYLYICVCVALVCGWARLSGPGSWGVSQRPQWPCLSEEVGPYRSWGGREINRPRVFWTHAGFTTPPWPSFNFLSSTWHLCHLGTRWIPPVEKEDAPKQLHTLYQEI